VQFAPFPSTQARSPLPLTQTGRTKGPVFLFFFCAPLIRSNLPIAFVSRACLYHHYVVQGLVNRYIVGGVPRSLAGIGGPSAQKCFQITLATRYLSNSLLRCRSPSFRKLRGPPYWLSRNHPGPPLLPTLLGDSLVSATPASVSARILSLGNIFSLIHYVSFQ